MAEKNIEFARTGNSDAVSFSISINFVEIFWHLVAAILLLKLSKIGFQYLKIYLGAD
ncbi:hypothetical protein [Acinetobacter rudis]|uniref:hypothetical protein n=1 Tax=Acinetobacter rudis TaxID=632955 RepID=UPI0003A2712F|nr:hypothetical protein [Acinetobacter rudis]